MIKLSKKDFEELCRLASINSIYGQDFVRKLQYEEVKSVKRKSKKIADGKEE